MDIWALLGIDNPDKLEKKKEVVKRLTQKDYYQLYMLVRAELSAGMGESQTGDDSQEAWEKIRDKLAEKAKVEKEAEGE